MDDRAKAMNYNRGLKGLSAGFHFVCVYPRQRSKDCISHNAFLT